MDILEKEVLPEELPFDKDDTDVIDQLLKEVNKEDQEKVLN